MSGQRYDKENRPVNPGDICLVSQPQTFLGKISWRMAGEPSVITVAEYHDEHCNSCGATNNHVVPIGLPDSSVCGCLLTKLDPEEGREKVEAADKILEVS